NNIAIDLHVGAYASYDLFGSRKYNDSDYDWDEDLQKFDAGINAGVGVWINKRINVNLAYRQGMVNMSDKDYGNNPSFYAHKIVFSLGYAF
ncbi:MAG: outer membrane beta-barrel protein, partial [Prevotella sp.]|nr:outer membrane beta-barrel protein [Prevotella sp.]